jgi:hypothetical protein
MKLSKFDMVIETHKNSSTEQYGTAIFVGDFSVSKAHRKIITIKNVKILEGWYTFFLAF